MSRNVNLLKLIFRVNGLDTKKSPHGDFRFSELNQPGKGVITETNGICGIEPKRSAWLSPVMQSSAFPSQIRTEKAVRLSKCTASPFS
jgi:hypothetical protein